MSSTATNIEKLLNGEEIEPIGKYDFSFRRVPNDKVPLFRGLESQLTVNPDDKNRLQAWYGDELGHNEQVVLQSDFDEIKYLASFKNISVDLVSKTLTNTNYLINPEEYGVFILHVNGTVTLTLHEPSKAGRKVHIFVENINSKSTIKFLDETIQWVGNNTNFPTDTGAKYSVTLIYTGSGWIGEAHTGTGSSSTGSNSEGLVNACLNASIMSLGYCLPAGSSTDGSYPSKYAMFSGISNLSTDELINIAQAATNIGNINDVANSKEQINNVEDHIEKIDKVADNLDKIEELLKRYEALNTGSN